jgi:hypothetical protein
MKASDLLVACLEREGVEHVFGVPGEEMEDLLFSLRDSDLTFVPTRLAREAPVHVGHERGALLVAGGDERDVRVAQRKQKVFHLFAGHAKDVLHTFAFEAGDEEVGGFHDGTQTVEKSKRQGITPPNRRLGPVFCESLR